MGATRADRRWRHREQMRAVCAHLARFRLRDACHLLRIHRCAMSKRNFTARSDEVEFVFTAFFTAAGLQLHATSHAELWLGRRRQRHDGAPAPPPLTPTPQRLGRVLQPLRGRRQARASDGHVFLARARPTATRREARTAAGSTRARSRAGSSRKPHRCYASRSRFALLERRRNLGACAIHGVRSRGLLGVVHDHHRLHAARAVRRLECIGYAVAAPRRSRSRCARARRSDAPTASARACATR